MTVEWNGVRGENGAEILPTPLPCPLLRFLVLQSDRAILTLLYLLCFERPSPSGVTCIIVFARIPPVVGMLTDTHIPSSVVDLQQYL